MLIKSERGIALVLTLMILAIITAVVVEFTYGIYTTTSALYNWRDSQRLSLIAKSGVNVSLVLITSAPKDELYKYIGKDIPLENVSEGFSGRLIIKAEDENAKFNLNSVVWINGQKNAYDSFKRLLKNLNLDENIADRIADWIDDNSDPRLGDSEEGAKNGYFDSVDELLLIKGIDRKTYERLLPYVTVYSYEGTNKPGSALININTASVPVIMSFDDSIMKEDAERIVREREIRPFTGTGTEDPNFSSVAGSLKIFFAGKVVTKPLNFRITAIGEENKIRRAIECVIDTNAGNTIKYWREM